MGKRDVLFRLYVAARLPNSQRALANLTEFCRQHLADRHRIEVVDVFESPERALADNVRSRRRSWWWHPCRRGPSSGI